MNEFLNVLRLQRWDDHRYYHHSRINQSLHFVSALTFMACYGLLFVDPPLAALLAWGVAMVTRQSGHFFFEPRGYDSANQATHEHKEAIKVGYNLRRKIVLHLVWAAAPTLLLVEPTLFGLIAQPESPADYLRAVGVLWLIVGVAGLLVRVIYLMIFWRPLIGLAWAVKILTDPYHDILLYYKAPAALLRGELIDPNHGQRKHA